MRAGPCDCPQPNTYWNKTALADSTYDTFLAIKGANGTAPGAFCTIESGGRTTRTPSFSRVQTISTLPTPNNHVLNTYALPPSLIHQTCLANPACVGFRVKNDQSSGDILCIVKWGMAPGYFVLNR